jgi:hypothetical protein
MLRAPYLFFRVPPNAGAAAIEDRHVAGAPGQYAAETQERHAAGKAAARCVYMVSGHSAAQGAVRRGAAGPVLCSCISRAVYHPAFHAGTSHNGPSAAHDPMPASFYENRGSVSGSIHAAHSEYIPAV